MTERRQKLLNRLEQNPKAVTIRELETTLRAFGWYLDRQKGSHKVYRHATVTHSLVVPERRPHVGQHYVEQVISQLRIQL
jgi:predicted RNA binding protein YcfA (HicA-like mRNA interferase family)